MTPASSEKQPAGACRRNGTLLAADAGGSETANTVEAARQKLLAEGKPVFIIGSHYEITGELSFYLPEARAGLPDHPVVYYQSSRHPDNQFYYWPGYTDRKGQNAVYVKELDFR